MELDAVFGSVKRPDEDAAGRARAHWKQVAKPLGGLGLLEEDIIRIAAVRGSEDIRIDNKWIAVMCADNGIVAEGISQSGQDVTAAVAKGMGKGTACVCRMAGRAGARVFPVDVGIACKETIPGLLNRRVAPGTRNFLHAPAMSREQAVKAVKVGIEVANFLSEKGCNLAGCGEMGIGNTTTAAAVISAFSGLDACDVAGRGAGLDHVRLEKKIRVIREGIRLHRPDPSDPLDVLSKVGGFDIAALAGFMVGCGACRIPVVLDGVITGAAALAAVRLVPALSGYLIASHESAEPAGALALTMLGLKAPIHAGFCLGEGTGAAALFSLLDMAADIYRDMADFGRMEIEPYQDFRAMEAGGKG